jgi:hypothetical protein
VSEEAVTHGVNPLDNKADSRLSTLIGWAVQEATSNGHEYKLKPLFVFVRVHSQSLIRD